MAQKSVPLFVPGPPVREGTEYRARPTFAIPGVVVAAPAVAAIVGAAVLHSLALDSWAVFVALVALLAPLAATL